MFSCQATGSEGSTSLAGWAHARNGIASAARADRTLYRPAFISASPTLRQWLCGPAPPRKAGSSIRSIGQRPRRRGRENLGMVAPSPTRRQAEPRAARPALTLKWNHLPASGPGMSPHPSSHATRRAAITAAWSRDESEHVRELLAVARQPRADWSDADRAAVQETAADLVRRVRARAADQGAIEAFMRQYDLGSEEGVLLMCVAEALLRI